MIENTKLIEALETIAEETDVSVKEIIDLLTGFCWDEEEGFGLEQRAIRRLLKMTKNTKLIEALENTFDSNIDDWVEEVMWDYKLENTVYDREIIKKILKFGYYTSVHAVEELQ